MPAPQSFNKILLTTSNESEKNITLQEISGQLYINDHLVITSENIGLLSDITTIESDVTTLQTDLTTLDTSVSTLQSEVSTLQESSGTSEEETFTNTYSLSFDGGNDYMQTSSDTALGSASAFTLAVWFKTSDTDGGKEAILSMGTSTYFAIRTNGSNVEIREASGGTTIGQHSTTGWNFAVVVHDGTTLKGSLNGASFVTRTPQYTLPQSGYNTPLAVGRLISYGQYFPGLVDEAAYWTSALSFSDVTAMYNSGVPTDISSYSPVGWWRMGDNDGGTGTTVTDQGSGSNDATLTNGPTFSTDTLEAAGPFVNTYSLSFDGGNDYVSVTQDGAINISGDITLSAWVKRNSTTSYNAIYTKRQVGGSMNYQFIINNTNGLIGLGHSGGSWVYNTDTTLATSTWYHVAVTVSSGTAQFYVNGVAEDSFTGISITATTHNLIIGATAGYNYFNGNIDEASVFNSALSSSDITSIYNSGAPADLSSYSPVGWWRMGDNNSGTGATITDKGSGGNDATLTNGPTFSTTIPS